MDTLCNIHNAVNPFNEMVGLFTNSSSSSVRLSFNSLSLSFICFNFSTVSILSFFSFVNELIDCISYSSYPFIIIKKHQNNLSFWVGVNVVNIVLGTVLIVVLVVE